MNRKIKTAFCYMILLVIMAVTMVGCKTSKEPSAVVSGQDTKTHVLGEGQTKFTVVVVDKEKKETHFEIHTDKTTVGEALLDVGLVEGEMGEFGLFVKSVNGITADYAEDQTYWAFYIDGEYAVSGMDLTTIEEGTIYSLKVEK